GGTLLDPQTITGRTPAHVAGPVSLLVRTPIGDAQLPDAFAYAPPPLIVSITPESGDPNAGTSVRVRGAGFTFDTKIFFGVTLASAEPCEEQNFVNEAEIQCVAPGGTGRASVWAFDAEVGWTRLPDGFGWSDP